MGDTNDNGGFDIQFTKLPPELVVKMWALALDADTSKVNLAYKPGAFTTSLAYSYSGSLLAAFANRRFSSSLGFNPSSGNVDLGLVYRGFKFSASENLARPAAGLSLSYGAALLPFPNELATSFRAANGALQTMAGDLRSATSNPLRYYNLHSNDEAAIGVAIHQGQAIYDSEKSPQKFGFGLRLNYTPQSGLVIYGGAQLSF